MDRSILRAASLTLLTTAFAISCGQVAEEVDTPTLPDTVLAAEDQRVSGPYAHENLEIFLIHGNDRIPAEQRVLTLSEALEQEQVVVHETGDVNELAIENLSQDCHVFVQSGDIVQGGKQDRTIAIDLVLAPGSGKVPLASFCVESGRWSGRTGGEVESFASSRNALSTLDLKRAVKLASDQGQVWQQVDETQSKLEAQLGEAGIRASGSATSLELTLSGDAVRGNAEPYVAALDGILDGKDDVIGFAFAINGAVNSAEVYGSHALFRQLWPKLLYASSVEALTEGTGGGAPLTADVVGAFLDQPSEAEPTTREVGKDLEIVQVQNTGNDLFETRYRGGSWIHRSYLAR